MSDYCLDEIWVWAASKGLPLAHASLAAQCLQFAQVDPARQADWLAGAEAYASLARQSGEPEHTALLGSVMVARFIQFSASDPVRAIDYRELADLAFDQVEQSGCTSALSIVGFALSKLADLEDEDASNRLNRVIAALPAGAAALLRESVRATDEPVAPTDNGGVK